MNIGIVTTWFERGAAYVSRAYMENLESEGHKVSIYARGGEHMAKDDEKWNCSNVTWGKKLVGTNINKKHFFKWIETQKLDAILFNEQSNLRIVALTKLNYPNIKLCAYVDYYTEKLIPFYNIYDFLICNTKRHMEAMESHPQKFYLRWGTDTGLFKPSHEEHEKLVFFHSVGMSPRKGTDVLLDAFIHGKLYENSKLVIHTQIPVEKVSSYTTKELERYNIEIVEKTVTAPGLYYLGDVYVYPTRLDGLGLTMYEALSCGLPVITTNYPPMNEIIDEAVGRLVKVKRHYSRQDAYYWPMSICDEESLISIMDEYIKNPQLVRMQQRKAREKAVEYFDWKKQSTELSKIFEEAKVRDISIEFCKSVLADNDKGYVYNWLRENECVTNIKTKIRGC